MLQGLAPRQKLIPDPLVRFYNLINRPAVKHKPIRSSPPIEIRHLMPGDADNPRIKSLRPAFIGKIMRQHGGRHFLKHILRIMKVVHKKRYKRRSRRLGGSPPTGDVFESGLLVHNGPLSSKGKPLNCTRTIKDVTGLNNTSTLSVARHPLNVTTTLEKSANNSR